MITAAWNLQHDSIRRDRQAFAATSSSPSLWRLALYVAWLVRGVLVLLYVSALFAVVLTPVVRATSRIRIGRWQPFQGSAAILILLLAVAGALTGFGFLALPPVIRDLQSLNGELPTRVPALLAKLQEIPFADRLNSGQVIAWIQGSLSQAAAYLLLSLKDWAGALVQIIAGFVLTLYFILEGEGAYRWFLSFLPPQPRQRLDDTLQRAAIRMQKWLLGQASLMLILGLASTIVYLSLDVRYAYALGVLTGLLNIDPGSRRGGLPRARPAGGGHRFLGTRARRRHLLPRLSSDRKLPGSFPAS